MNACYVVKIIEPITEAQKNYLSRSPFLNAALWCSNWVSFLLPEAMRMNGLRRNDDLTELQKLVSKKK